MVPRLGYVCIHVQIDWLSIYTTTVRLNDCERAMKRCRYRQTERQRDGQRDICRLANSFDSGSWSNRNLEPIIQMQKQARHACTAISLALCSYCFCGVVVHQEKYELADGFAVPQNPCPCTSGITTTFPGAHLHRTKTSIAKFRSLIDRHRYYSSK